MFFKTRYQASKYKASMGLGEHWRIVHTLEGYVLRRGLLTCRDHHRP